MPMFARKLLRSVKTLEKVSEHMRFFWSTSLTECVIHITLIGTAALLKVLNYIGIANLTLWTVFSLVVVTMGSWLTSSEALNTTKCFAHNDKINKNMGSSHMICIWSVSWEIYLKFFSISFEATCAYWAFKFACMTWWLVD